MVKAAIVVPYRNREAYLQVFLERVPAYLSKNGPSDFIIIVSEQIDNGMFNLALSRNVGALYALAVYRPEYLVFHDVDMIPVKGIDYNKDHANLVWFVSAGSSKIHSGAFVAVNGFNHAFVGWCYEDSEFWLSLIALGFPVDEWKHRSEARMALILTLEHPPMSPQEAEALSRRYWGNGPGPTFVRVNDVPNGADLERRYDKTDDFLCSDATRKNSTLCERIKHFGEDDRRRYFANCGSNLLDIEAISDVRKQGCVCHVTYETGKLLRQRALG
jgi:hypothetical protein